MFDHSAPPTQEQVRKYISHKVLSTRPGGRLPTVRQIGQACRVSPVTVQIVVQRLQSEGVIEARPRQGLFKPATARDAPDLVGLLDVVFFSASEWPMKRQDQFHAALMNDLSALCGKRMQGVRVHAMPVHASDEQINDLASRGDCQAAILINVPDRRPIQVFQRAHVPLVNLFPAGPSLEPNSVAIDNEQVMNMQVAHLRERGHERLGLFHQIDPEYFHRDMNARREAFHRLVAEAGLPFQADWCQRVGYDAHEIAPVVRRLFSRPADERPSAIIAPDSSLFVVYQTLTDMGLQVGQDVSILGTDDLISCEMLSPRASSLRIDRPTAAKMALKMLDNRVMGLAHADVDWVPLSIVQRDSVAHHEESGRRRGQSVTPGRGPTPTASMDDH